MLRKWGDVGGGDTRYGNGLGIQFIDEVHDDGLGSIYICYLQPLPSPRFMVSYRSTSSHKLALSSLSWILHSYRGGGDGDGDGGGGSGDTGLSSHPPLCLSDRNIIAVILKGGISILETE